MKRRNFFLTAFSGILTFLGLRKVEAQRDPTIPDGVLRLTNYGTFAIYRRPGYDAIRIRVKSVGEFSSEVQWWGIICGAYDPVKKKSIRPPREVMDLLSTLLRTGSIHDDTELLDKVWALLPDASITIVEKF